MRVPVIPAKGRDFLGSALFASAVTTMIFLTAFGTHLIRSLIGWPGLLAIVGALVVLAVVSLWFRRAHIAWHGTLPISLVVFVGWALLSVFWTTTTLLSAGRLVYFIAFAALGFYVAVLRDTIQIVRAVGDAMRVLLVTSIALEVLSGVLIDLPIRFLGIEGNLASLGPIQGVFGTRNQLGFVALIALITFAIETTTRSIPRNLGRASILLAAVSILLSRSPVMIAVIAVVAIAALALFGIRRVPVHNRWIFQVSLLGLIVVGLVVGWIARSRIIDALNAGSEFGVRYRLWVEMGRYLDQNLLQGWGWVGAWPSTPPYLWLNLATHKTNSSGLNAFIDVLFQLGLVGFIAFTALVGLALVRSWLLASDKRSIVYVWPALVLVALAAVSMAESTTLFEAGWLLLVVCAIKASRSMSWRDALLRRGEPGAVPVE